MSAYVVFFKESTHDQAEVDAYLASVRDTFEGHPAKILAAYGEQQVLEGAAPEGVVVIEFPTAADARSCGRASLQGRNLPRRSRGRDLRVGR
ncbi:DUF1330 domain-containing protein [Promicromonospora iranensis]|uniref:DUF1330 domain-containing protein n=1 Tax=Promicromonospora iranensis TaxID=1105144 RepID=UPI0023A9596A|nr:DUF1330 domain-containing protein [Promicromonospora iranensis]